MILYVTSNKAKISVKDNTFVIEEGDLIRSVPAETLDSVLLFGKTELTHSCIRNLLIRGIPVTFLSSKGEYFGRLMSTSHSNIARIKKQIACTADTDLRMKMAKQFVCNKIKNQTVVLRAYQRTHKKKLDDVFTQLRRAAANAVSAENEESLMGYEGIASRSYFQGLSSIIHPDFRFSGRTRRPPKDAFNSMLSLGYTLLLYEFVSVIESQGLSAYAGFLHKDRVNHPTLASDLMEEWRAVIVDRVALSLVLGREISIDSFVLDEETGGVRLDNTAMRKFLTKLEMKMKTNTNYLQNQMAPMSFRKAIGHQVTSLVRVIEDRDPDLYNAMVIR
ncbi:MAG: CRISPR-associated endonuclease Cas1 [Tissierellia bacterium]|nr:CRISPR-associated endonuclease Cas1 [Tissierellia bacterium]